MFKDLFLYLFIYLCIHVLYVFIMCVAMCVYVHMCSSAFRGQKKVLNALQLEVQDVALSLLHCLRLCYGLCIKFLQSSYVEYTLPSS